MKQPKLIRRCSYRIRLANSYQSYRLQVIPGGPGARAVPSNRSGCTNSSPCQAVTPHELAPADITGILCYTAIKRGTTRGRNQLAKHSLNKWNRTLLEDYKKLMIRVPRTAARSLSLSLVSGVKHKEIMTSNLIEYIIHHTSLHTLRSRYIKSLISIHFSHFRCGTAFRVGFCVPWRTMASCPRERKICCRSDTKAWPLAGMTMRTQWGLYEDSMRTLCIMIRIIS